MIQSSRTACCAGSFRNDSFEQVGGRTEASALIGNDGQLALLAALALLVLAGRATEKAGKASLFVMAVPLLVTVVLTRNVTSILMLVAEGLILLAKRLTRGPPRGQVFSWLFPGYGLYVR